MFMVLAFFFLTLGSTLGPFCMLPNMLLSPALSLLACKCMLHLNVLHLVPVTYVRHYFLVLFVALNPGLSRPSFN